MIAYTATVGELSLWPGGSLEGNAVYYYTRLNTQKCFEGAAGDGCFQLRPSDLVLIRYEITDVTSPSVSVHSNARFVPIMA